MRRTVEGLRAPSHSLPSYPEGRVLASVHRVIYIHGAKPYFAVTFKVIEPRSYAGRQVTSRLYCTNRALWKLQWFLRDFKYDSELLSAEQIDDKALIGLKLRLPQSLSQISLRTSRMTGALKPACASAAAMAWMRGVVAPFR